MLLLEAQYLSNLPIAQRSLPLAHLPSDLCALAILLQKFLRWHGRRDGIIRRIEDLEP